MEIKGKMSRNEGFCLRQKYAEENRMREYIRAVLRCSHTHTHTHTHKGSRSIYIESGHKF
jgi:hypothetical protein